MKDRFITFLKARSDRWVPKTEIQRACEVSGISPIDAEIVYMQLDRTANIGRQYNRQTKTTEYRYYEPREGDDFMQAALDSF